MVIPEFVSTEACLETRSSDECDAIEGYYSTRDWLTENLKVTEQMKRDIVAQVDKSVAKDLQELLDRDEFEVIKDED